MFIGKSKVHFVTPLLIILAILFIASCATDNVGQEFEAGRLYAYEIAKKDASNFQCFRYTSDVLAAFKDREKHMEIIRTQGKSQVFVEGFYYGYEQTYKDQLVAKCGE